MQTLLILGGGTAGTMIANKLSARLDRSDWRVIVVDKDDIHDYQPGYLFIPFGINTPEQVRRSMHTFLAEGVELVMGEVDVVEPDAKLVRLEGGREIGYDYLVIATGTTPRPDQTPGMLGDEWHKSVNEFYTFEGALALRDALRRFEGGRLVMHITELPIKCPVAPLEFVMLADDYLRERGLRERTEIVYVTPLDGAFTKPVASRELGHHLEQRHIQVEPDFMIESVDQERKVIVSYDEREVAYDLLVTVPLNMGADFVARSGLGDELNYVPVDKHTMRSTAYGTIFALGDAGNLPTSKAGSVAHFSVEIFVENFLQLVAGKPMTHSFDGHANCFVESGGGKALLLDFNYDTEPLTGTFPLPKVGPMSLLKESRANHLGKLAFRHIYWNILLPGRPMPLPAAMSMSGKNVE
ncbi:MAG TPA: FAD/NAD(P)-binding oxidoreductase [Dermatophilaceae bacterium]|jgi:sulfide:quinone oxidoreductase|nr:FAD/NAD(P)-binding oxidoreductase [Dermatophilaceae bacterium]